MFINAAEMMLFLTGADNSAAESENGLAKHFFGLLRAGAEAVVHSTTRRRARRQTP